MSNNDDKKIQKFADMFKALSNPHRLRIFLRLISCCPPRTLSDFRQGVEPEGCACVGDLGLDLGIVASTISHHVKELKQAGLIRMERKGQKIECSIEQDTLVALQDFFTDRREPFLQEIITRMET